MSGVCQSCWHADGDPEHDCAEPDTCTCAECWYGPPSAEELRADAQEVGSL